MSERVVGLLVGRENTFPQPFIDVVNHRGADKGVRAEMAVLGGARELEEQGPGAAGTPTHSILSPGTGRHAGHPLPTPGERGPGRLPPGGGVQVTVKATVAVPPAETETCRGLAPVGVQPMN